jgi:nucleoside phosphorylase
MELEEACPILWVHCAIQDEYNETLKVFQNCFGTKTKPSDEKGFYHRKMQVGNFQIAFSSNGGNDAQGSGNTAQALQKVLAFEPDFVFMPGCCGGSPRTSQGDVILVSRAVPYQLGSQDVDEFRSDASQAPELDNNFVLRISDSPQDFPDWWQYVEASVKELIAREKMEPRVQAGPVLSGDSVRGDLTEEKWNMYAKVLATKKLFAVECESYPLYKQVQERRLCVKGVQDSGFQKGADTKKYRKLSIQLSASFLATLIKEEPGWFLKRRPSKVPKQDPMPQLEAQDPFPKPPINDWARDRFIRFTSFLDHLQALSLHLNLESWTSVSPRPPIRLAFDFPEGTIRSAFHNWFIHFYNKVGKPFGASIWHVLQHNKPNTNSLLEAIQAEAEFRVLFQ